MKKLSEHLSLAEAVKSNTATRLGISNIPNEAELKRLKVTAEKVFEPLRAKLGGRPIRVSSMFRSDELNEAINGSPNSQHRLGLAMDLDNDGLTGRATNREIFYTIKDEMDFDQLIWEFGDSERPDWVHVSWDLNNNRKEVLIAYREDGRTKYKHY